jgi:LmbE family N-acetylglucosaminyl deacetylase
MTELGTILSVWAHPDDETYLAGAIMARAVRAGDRVVCVTATRGEQGSSDPERWPPGPPLAELRTRELEKALAELGVTEHLWLDYPDGGCAQVPEAQAVTRLVDLIEDVRPDTILTFGPDGMTGHEDHRAVCRWTTAAVATARRDPSAGRHPGRVPGCDPSARRNPLTLHYATSTPQMLAVLKTLTQELWDSISMGGEPPVTPPEEVSLYLRAEGDLLDRKTRALTHQASQTQPLITAIGEGAYRALIAEEAFRRAGD